MEQLVKSSETVLLKQNKVKHSDFETLTFYQNNKISDHFIKEFYKLKLNIAIKRFLFKEKNYPEISKNSFQLNIKQIAIKNLIISHKNLIDIDGLNFEQKHTKVFGEIFPKLKKRLKVKHPVSSLINLVLPPLKLSDPSQLFKPLWKSQITGIEFLINNNSALLADDPGLGKTVQSIMALKILFQKGKIKRALVVVPKSTIGNKEASIETGDARQWEGHFELWAEELTVKTILPVVWEGGVPPKGFSGNTSFDRKKEWKEPAHIYLTTYALIRNDINKRVFPSDYFDAVVLDEVHNVKNPNSQQSIALRSLDADYKWGLTGTPVQNYPKELYAISQFLDPINFPSLKSRDYDEISEEEITKMCKPFFIRRTKKKDDLPPKIRHDHWLQLTEDQKKSYDQNFQIRKQRLIDLLNLGASVDQQKKSILGAITNLKQLCNFDPITLSSNKLDLLNKLINNSQKNNEKILVFSQFLNFGIDKIFNELNREGTNCLSLVGSMGMAERNENIELFKTNKNYDILLCSIKTAGVGLNLEEASTVIHFDHWWNPAIMWQAEDRAHRFGQTKEVNVHSFWIKDTIEEKIFKLLKSKEAMISRIMSEMGDNIAESAIEKEIGIEELMELFDL